MKKDDEKAEAGARVANIAENRAQFTVWTMRSINDKSGR